MNDHDDCPRVALYTAADLVAALREAGAERDRLDAVDSPGRPSHAAALRAAAVEARRLDRHGYSVEEVARHLDLMADAAEERGE